MTGKEALDDYKDFGKIKGESITSNHTFVPKEALRILSECANGEKKLLFSDSLDLEKVVKKELDELTKYKRAFEILKENAQISIKKCLWDGETIYYLVINQEYGDQIQFRLSKEEKTLIEELMKDENTK